MDQVAILRRYGVFDAKVPRYTSYPPANRFESGVGARFQEGWLKAVPTTEPVSLYIHIPFCRRLCWFCACRTQGTKTLGPVKAYVDVLLKEIARVAAIRGAERTQMLRLHLGGGTPTLLSAAQMTRLLDKIDAHFVPVDGFEFSVEVDPTEASPAVLEVLAKRGMNRASIGVQDFNPKVQKAIGRIQSFEQTRKVIETMRAGGVRSLNIDFLYGLPFQSEDSLIETLERVVSLRPDRLALYGYAHVPHVSKRQVMIPEEALPGAEARFLMAQAAKARLVAKGYEALGIDHFALPHDSLTVAAGAGTMTRNFQGYTDDPCETLIGFGASAISKYPGGYVQNAVATAAYTQRVQDGGLAGHKGYALSEDDTFVGALINALMCDGAIPVEAMCVRFPERRDEIMRLADELVFAFPDLLSYGQGGIAIPEELTITARIIAAHLDRVRVAKDTHSLAV